MAMKRCPVCGEKYSDTYKTCPFCEEEEAERSGGKIRRGGRRSASKGQPNLLTPTLVVLILIMLALLVYLLFGDQFQKKEETPNTPVEEVTPGEEETGEGETPAGEDGEVDMPEDPSVPSTGDDTQEEPDTSGELTYEKASALPDGLSLSTTDFTLKTVGESHTVTASGGSGSYTWISEDEGIASVDSSGKITAVSRGTVNVLVTDGSKKAVCIVRCNVSGSADSSSGTSSSGTSTSSSSLKAGSAVVTNAGNGVFVRSGPGTENEALATLSNGAEVKIVESAGSGWYKITFAGNGGVDTTGYMKGEFLANQ